MTVDPSISSVNADNFVRLLLSRIPRNRPTYNQIFERKVKSTVLSCLSQLPKAVRQQLFMRLPDQMQERLGSDNFQVNFKPQHFLPEELSRAVDFENWKNILLMPRDELRLKANI